MTDAMLNHPDDIEAAGPFEIRPLWPRDADEDSEWEVARPTRRMMAVRGVMVAAVAVCPDRATAQTVCDALNAAYPAAS